MGKKIVLIIGDDRPIGGYCCYHGTGCSKEDECRTPALIAIRLCPLFQYFKFLDDQEEGG
ncbi:MAG: hypothetical protein KAS39_05235 [Actinomycetia bacterium]|nr:hypothetical protein [Actinomycetes bacterium]